MHLQEILYLPKFEVFGANLTFDLKTLLVDHGGPNPRNGTAHGVRSYQEFFSPEALYFWCLTLRLCFPPLLHQLLADAASLQKQSFSEKRRAPLSPLYAALAFLDLIYYISPKPDP
jgi:hypothetical protein